MERIMEANVSILGEIAAEFFPERVVPIFRGAQVDGVCPRCRKWHTVALHNGLPFCFVIEKETERRIAAKGVIQ